MTALFRRRRVDGETRAELGQGLSSSAACLADRLQDFSERAGKACQDVFSVECVDLARQTNGRVRAIHDASSTLGIDDPDESRASGEPVTDFALHFAGAGEAREPSPCGPI